MLEYLVNYGMKKHNSEFQDLDINDRTELQNQINEARKNYFQLLQLFNGVQDKFLDCNADLAGRAKELMNENEGIRNNKIFNTDDLYLSIEAKQEALKAGMQMIQAQIDYYKNDLRILNSVFYNKF